MATVEARIDILNGIIFTLFSMQDYNNNQPRMHALLTQIKAEEFGENNTPYLSPEIRDIYMNLPELTPNAELNIIHDLWVVIQNENPIPIYDSDNSQASEPEGIQPIPEDFFIPALASGKKYKSQQSKKNKMGKKVRTKRRGRRTRRGLRRGSRRGLRRGPRKGKMNTKTKY